MATIEEKLDVTNLYAIYQTLLTKKQQEIFEMYYYEDMSINEIAEELNVTKNAIFNNIKKAEKHLLEFENQLHIYYNYEYNISLLEAHQISKKIIEKIK